MFTDRTDQSGGNGGLIRLLYVHEDIMGNTRYYTKATGQSFAELEYDVWGAPSSPSKLTNNDNGNFAAAVMTGHPYDTVLDIYFAEARFYDAKYRQWMASDPIKDGLNWYEYVGSNPTTYFDPTGLYYIIETTNELTGETYYEAIPEGPINVFIRALTPAHASPYHNNYGVPYEVVGGNSYNYDDMYTIIADDMISGAIQDLVSGLVTFGSEAAGVYLGIPQLTQYADAIGQATGFAVANFPGAITSDHWDIRKNDKFIFEVFDEFRIGVTSYNLEQLELKMGISNQILGGLKDSLDKKIDEFGKSYWEIMKLFGNDSTSDKQQKKFKDKFLNNMSYRDAYLQLYLAKQSGFSVSIYRGREWIFADKETQEIILMLMKQDINAVIDAAKLDYNSLKEYFKTLFCYNTVVEKQQ